MTGWEYLVLSLPAFGVAKPEQGHSDAVDILNREGAAGINHLPAGELERFAARFMAHFAAPASGHSAAYAASSFGAS